MLYATGSDENDLKKAQVGIVSTGFQGNPCNMHLNDLASEVKKEVDIQENLYGLIFHTIGVSDGITNGTEGMKYSLPSCEFIADSIETVVSAQFYDAVIPIVENIHDRINRHKDKPITFTLFCCQIPVRIFLCQGPVNDIPAKISASVHQGHQAFAHIIHIWRFKCTMTTRFSMLSLQPETEGLIVIVWISNRPLCIHFNPPSFQVARKLHGQFLFLFSKINGFSDIIIKVV